MTAPLTLLRHREALRAHHEASTRSQLEAVERKWARTPVDNRTADVFDDGSEREIRKLEWLVAVLSVTVAGMALAWVMELLP